MKRVLITGGSGFLGTNLVEKLVSAQYQVLNIDIAAPRKANHEQHWQELDILHLSELKRVFQVFQPDIVFHLAARTDLDGQNVEAYRTNTEGVRNVVEAARSLRNLKRIIFASSMLVCKLGYRPIDEFDCNPVTHYGESKVIGEQIVRHESGESLPWIIVRPTSIWGPWFDVPYKNFFDAIRKGHYFHPAGLRVERSYGFVFNSVHQLVKLATSDSDTVQSKTFYLADYEPLELREWSLMIQQAMQVRPIRDVPLVILRCAAKAGDLLQQIGIKNVPLTTFRLSNMRTDVVFDMNPLREICGELPYDTEQGVQATVEWMNQFEYSDSSE